MSAFESIISKGAKVVEKDLVKLIELLMNQLLKLDGIVAEGDVKLQRKMQVITSILAFRFIAEGMDLILVLFAQVKRVQKYVETLDVLKMKNSAPSSNGDHIPKQESSPSPHQHQRRYSNELASPPVQSPNGRSPRQAKHQEPSRHSASGSVVITTQWETFDPAPGPLLDHYSTTTPSNNNHASSAQPRFNWDLL